MEDIPKLIVGIESAMDSTIDAIAPFLAEIPEALVPGAPKGEIDKIKTLSDELGVMGEQV